MRIKDVNLPQPLLEAQTKDRLVVFAGAGISVDPPSNLPNFKELAAQVAAGALTQGKDEPYDRFLGRLDRQGVKVHLRTQEITGNPASQPNQLHRILISLFRSPDIIRIVTTNFDRHLSTAAQNILASNLETHYAPALPLGGQFHGLVYLHGSVDKEPERLVLTDRDFGRAYLTEGWATRFLYEMFLAYTVLFVGYSHDDPVMSYLSRGLPPEISQPRYALVPPGQSDKWQFLGITPVDYPLRAGTQRHAALGEALAGLTDLVRMGALDHEARIRELVRSSPPIDPELGDYLESSLSDPVRLRFFTRHAKTIEWLYWLENKEPFPVLFEPNKPIDDVAREITLWFSRSFVLQNPDECFSLIERHKQRLHPFLWQQIAVTLAHSKPRPESATLRRWIAVLLSSAHSDWSAEHLVYVLSDCKYPEDADTAILLFDYLTRPRLMLEPSFHFGTSQGPESPSADVEIPDRYYSLKTTWDNSIGPNLPYLAEQLEPIVTAHLSQAHLLLRAYGIANGRWDPVSFTRTAIEPHQQDHYRGSLSVLIDAGRDIIEWLLRNRPARADALIEAWSDSGILLLKRLAIHGVSEHPRMDGDQKITWLLAKGLLFAIDPRHEVFRLLEKAYPGATEATRKETLARVEFGPTDSDIPNIEERARDWQTLKVLDWLHRVFPGDSLSAERFEHARQRYPDFQAGEHPDLTHWTSVGWQRVASPISQEDLLRKEPLEVVELLATYPKDEFRNAERLGLLNSVNEAAAEHFDWGWQLAVTLQDKRDSESDLWESIFQGWDRAKLNDDQWIMVLELLRDNPQLWRNRDSAIDLLTNGVAAENTTLPSSGLAIAEELADAIWNTLDLPGKQADKTESDSWYGVARTHSSGKIVYLWLHALSKRWTERQGVWPGLPVDYSRRFEKVILGTSYSAQLGRIVLTAELAFLSNLDQEWTRKSIVPLLDWPRDEAQAEQAWHGYLHNGSWNDALLTDLMPLFRETFKVINKLGSRRNQFCVLLATISLYSSINPVEDGWLLEFIRSADPKSRVDWAAAIGLGLQELKDDSKPDLWKRWMDEYWRLRSTGVPISLSADEADQMLMWLVHLKPVFREAVDRALSINVAGSPVKHAGLYYQLEEEKLAEKQPEALARLLRYLLRNTAESAFFDCGTVDNIVRDLAATAVPRAELLAICEDLARLGCATAGELKDIIAGTRQQ